MIIILSKNTNQLNRKDELVNWFNAEYLKDKFIIIHDDKTLNVLPGSPEGRLIQTNGSCWLN